MLGVLKHHNAYRHKVGGDGYLVLSQMPDDLRSRISMGWGWGRWLVALCLGYLCSAWWHPLPRNDHMDITFLVQVCALCFW